MHNGPEPFNKKAGWYLCRVLYAMCCMHRPIAYRRFRDGQAESVPLMCCVDIILLHTLRYKERQKYDYAANSFAIMRLSITFAFHEMTSRKS